MLAHDNVVNESEIFNVIPASQIANFKMTPSLRNQKGMTLIEIMIVIAIIAGLMAVLGKNVMNNLVKSRVENTKILINEISKQLESYNLACGSYPTTDQGLGALVANPGAEVCPNWGPEPYFKKMQKDAWGTPFAYESDGNKFVIRSYGPSKHDGGAGGLSSEDP